MANKDIIMKITVVLALTIIIVAAPQIVGASIILIYVFCMFCPVIPFMLLVWFTGWFDDEEDDE